MSAAPRFSSRRCLGLLEEVWEALWRGPGLGPSVGFATLPVSITELAFRLACEHLDDVYDKTSGAVGCYSSSRRTC